MIFTNIFHDFNASGKFKRSLKATFITAILKFLWVVDLKGFHPIGLVGQLLQNYYKDFRKWAWDGVGEDYL
jgi:hypothetical protein